MGRPRKSSILKEFKRVREPDFEALAKVVAEAKGQRTAADFAALCGVHPTTISRILDGRKLRTQISDELIVAIAVNAESNNGDIFKRLLKVHGVAPINSADIRDYSDLLHKKMRDLTYNGQSYGVSNCVEFKSESMRTENAKQIILSDFFSKGLLIKESKNSDIFCGVPEYVLTNITCDFAMDVIDPCGNLKTKAYFVMDGSQYGVFSIILQMLGLTRLYPLKENVELYLVFYDKILFDQVKMELIKSSIPKCIILTFLDLKQRKIFEQKED